jgi:uncharacterized RDD family membrane protein YckC
MEWYYVQGSDQVGPVSNADLAKLARAGDISGETLVWREGLENWIAYEGTVPQAPARPEAPKLKLASNSDVSAGSGAQPLDDAPRDLTQPEKQAVDFMSYGGFWIRFAAKLLDSIIVLAVNGGIAAGAGLATAGLMQVLGDSFGHIIAFIPAAMSLMFCLFYYIYLVGKYGATWGKMICRMKIVRSDASPIGYGRALGRIFAEILSVFFLGIGYIMAAFDSEKRSLHDRICDTRVVRR